MLKSFSAKLPSIKIKPVRPTPWILWLGLLCLLLLIALVTGIRVFWHGLSLTNLTDLVPWGLWITIDLSSIALAAGAFSLCAAVYLIGLKRYQPIARTATFIGLIGYTMAMLSLLLDIGRPDRFWHALIYWNDWFQSLLYINKESMYSLQYVMLKTMRMIEVLERLIKMGADKDVVARIRQLPSETAQFAMVVIGIGPIILAYPFFQRFFVKGITIGAIKG